MSTIRKIQHKPSTILKDKGSKQLPSKSALKKDGDSTIVANNPRQLKKGPSIANMTEIETGGGQDEEE